MTPAPEDHKADAQLALLCLAAEQAGAVKGRPAPPSGYTLHGYLTAQDAVFRLGPLALGLDRVFYGWLLACPAGLLAVVRGTVGRVEWWEDAQWYPRTHAASGGFVEDGFGSLSDTLELEALDGASLGPAARALADMCGEVTITGHSLGGALATYLAAEVGHAGCRVKARIFASPRPGDAAFGVWAERSMDDVVSYRFAPDIVPDVPAGLGYQLLPGTVVLPDDRRVRRAFEAYHHVTGGYAPQLDPTIPIDPSCLA